MFAFDARGSIIEMFINGICKLCEWARWEKYRTLNKLPVSIIFAEEVKGHVICHVEEVGNEGVSENVIGVVEQDTQ